MQEECPFEQLDTVLIHSSNESEGDKNVQELQLLMFYQNEPSNLFPNAEIYPEFFNENLVSEDRVIKVFYKSIHANIQVFYYQLLLLSSAVEQEDAPRRRIVEKFKQMVFSEEFEVLFTRDTEQYREIFNNYQFKKLLEQFYALLESASEGAEAIINRIPIVDTIFIHIIRSLLYYMGINEEFQKPLDTQAVFIQLAQALGLKITCYSWVGGMCWKFEDSDMFCLDDGSGNLFLTYVPIDKVSNNQSSKISVCRQQDSGEQKSDGARGNYSETGTSDKAQYNKGIAKESTHLTTSRQDVEMNKLSISNIESICLGSETLLNTMSNNFDNYRQQTLSGSSFSKNNYQSTHLSSQTIYDSSKFDPVPHYSFPCNRVSSQYQPLKDKQTEKEDATLLPPSNKYSPHDTSIEELTKCSFLKNKNIEYKQDTSIQFKEWRPAKYDSNTSRIKEKSISEYYKDFTSSFLLDTIRQPYKTEVRNIKTRIKNLKKQQF